MILNKTKKNVFLILIFSVFLIYATPCNAAILHGTVYDLELNELNDVIIEVNSKPVQRFVSKDGLYSFNLVPGNYSITAKYIAEDYSEISTTENISIINSGNYVFDLFMFPDFGKEYSTTIKDTDAVLVPDNIQDIHSKYSLHTIMNKNSIFSLLIIIVGIILFILILIASKRKKSKSNQNQKFPHKHARSVKTELKNTLQIYDPNLIAVINFIEQDGGRTTQKKLRKNIPLSEAKISLMVSELEEKGIIKKIKKGRGNIISLR